MPVSMEPPISMEVMLQTIRTGLPKTLEPKNIIIVGAGISGLVAASLLKGAGHEVTVLEGNDRIGGRIFTNRNFYAGQYMENGAMRLPSIHLLVLEYIKKFNLPLEEFINSTPNDIIYVNNVRTIQKLYEENPDILNFPTSPSEKGKTAEYLAQYSMQPVTDFIKKNPKKNWEIVIKLLDRYSMEYYLKYNPYGRTLSVGAIDMIKVMLGMEGFPELSFTALLREVMILFTPGLKFYEIKGGNDHLPYSFLPELKENIFFHQKMKKIEQHDSSVTIHTEDTQTSQAYTVTGDLAIITIPFSLLNFVEIIPRDLFSYNKYKAIRQLHYVPSTKIGLQFKTRFWEKEGFIGGKMISDLPVRYSYFPSQSVGSEGPGVILASYTWEDNASIWDSLTEKEQIENALEDLSKIYGKEIYNEFITGNTFSWSENPFSGGAFAIFKPDQQTEIAPYISTPEGLIHFAGDHTSTAPGWIQGAIESGIRVAYEVNDLPKSTANENFEAHDQG
ncbi:flavin monoamine oxidase family protein [Gottfriedia sp. NPDC057991]|uniref:flavin monoamine oxidase family protein n=1 Tax=Gottfriedia sp. NPDC057991 TaxID=3346298 RepID=UPI0036DEB41B